MRLTSSGTYRWLDVVRAWAVKGEDMGGIGGGELEHPRQGLGANWAGWEPSEEAQEPSWGTAKGGL